jgi:hypothetical protein
VSPDGNVVVEVFGEGKTDVAASADPEEPRKGVVAILVHTLCGEPPRMRVKRKAFYLLHGKGLWQKVAFAKRQAYYNRSAAAVFVVDSEGDEQELNKKRTEMEKGRDHEFPKFHAAVGVAQPCIEAWLLADASAIRRAFDMPAAPEVPAEPEKCPAPRQDEKDNPKAILARVVGLNRKLSAGDNWRIAAEMKDMGLVRTRFATSFAPFADEVEARIRPLFSKSA